jgi:hypothetical protein
MKKVLFLLTYVFICSTINGQDRIVRKNGITEDCHIIRIDSSKVCYNSNLDGYNIYREADKKDIKGILFGIEPSVTKKVIKEEKVIKEPEKNEPQANVIIYKNHQKTENEFQVSEPGKYFVFGTAFSLFKGDTKLWFDGYERFIRPFSLDVGFGFNKALNKDLNLQYGIEYFQKGMRYFNNESYEKIILRINYLELPVSLKYSPESWQKPNMKSHYIKGGLAPALKITSNYKHKITRLDDYNYNDKSSKGEIPGVKSIDLNYFIAFGVNTGRNYNFEIKYEAGILDIMDKNATAITLYNRSLSVNFVLTFN